MSIRDDFAWAAREMKARDIGVSYEPLTVVIPKWILTSRPEWEPEIRELIRKSEEENQSIRFVLYEDGD